MTLSSEKQPEPNWLLASVHRNMLTALMRGSVSTHLKQPKTAMERKSWRYKRSNE